MSAARPAQPTHYRVIVQGHIIAARLEWLGAVAAIDAECGQTVLCGPVADQAALYGLLWRVRDAGLTLVSVNRFEPSALEPQV